MYWKEVNHNDFWMNSHCSQCSDGIHWRMSGSPTSAGTIADVPKTFKGNQHRGYVRGNCWISSSIMLLVIFDEPTLLEKVVLQSHYWKMVLQEERICSIDFMESTFYVIILDPQIQDLIHL